MSFWVGVGVLVVGLLASIAWHELGHLIPAKRFGVLVTQYMVGFGSTLWSTSRGETEYGIKAIPLGGYIRMVGMYPTATMLQGTAATAARVDEALLAPGGDEADRHRLPWRRAVAADARAHSASEIPAGSDHRAFALLSVPKKLVVMAGGPVMNLILAFALLVISYVGIGLPTTTTTVATIAPCVLEWDAPADAECTDADPAAPALEAGLLAGDRVLTWAGVPIDSWETLQSAIRESSGDVEVTVERAGRVVALTVTPVVLERPVVTADGEVVETGGEVVTSPVPVVGISPLRELERQSLGEATSAFVWVVTETFRVVVTLPVELASVVGSTFGDAEREAGVVGPVGIGRLAGEVTSSDTDFGLAGRALMLLQLLASLNVALFAFNMVPLLPLDGGHIAGALWEGLRRRLARWRGRPDPGPVDTARLIPLTYAVAAALLGMMLLLTIADIVDPLTLTG